MNPIKLLGAGLKLLLKVPVAAVNQIPKGYTTGVGGVLVGAGLGLAGVAHSSIVTDQNLVSILEQIVKGIEAIGAVVIALGAQRHHGETGTTSA